MTEEFESLPTCSANLSDLKTGAGVRREGKGGGVYLKWETRVRRWRVGQLLLHTPVRLVRGDWIASVMSQ